MLQTFDLPRTVVCSLQNESGTNKSKWSMGSKTLQFCRSMSFVVARWHGGTDVKLAPTSDCSASELSCYGGCTDVVKRRASIYEMTQPAWPNVCLVHWDMIVLCALSCVCRRPVTRYTTAAVAAAAAATSWRIDDMKRYASAHFCGGCRIVLAVRIPSTVLLRYQCERLSSNPVHKHTWLNPIITEKPLDVRKSVIFTEKFAPVTAETAKQVP